MEQNAVADDMTAIAAGHELFGSIHWELREAVDSKIGEQLQRVRSLNVKVNHVMGLVEQNATLAPRGLLVAPVTVLRRDYGIDVCTYLRIPQHVDRVPG